MTKGLAIALLPLCAAAALTGCGQIAPARVGYLTAVNIVRPKSFFRKPLTMTITNVNTVTALYQDMRALKPFPSKGMHCPAEFAIDYRITFMNQSHIELTAYANPTGCSEVRLSSGTILWGVGKTGQAFWRELATALGMPRVSDLWSGFR